MSMDGLGTPQDILAIQTSDQRSHFLADGWTASFPSRFPAPPLQKGMLMPLEHRLGFHQLGRSLPSGPYPPRKLVASCTLSLSRRNLDELVSQAGCFGLEVFDL